MNMRIKNTKTEVSVWCCEVGADPRSGYLYARFHLNCHALEWAEPQAKLLYEDCEMVVMDGKRETRFRGKRAYPPAQLRAS
jgi:hypothetical protein